MIMDFGRNSFVTWPTSLVERVKMAEKEIQMRPIKFRQAIFVNGKFESWHYWGFVKDGFIGPVDVCLRKAEENSYPFVTKDKNGKDVYAGDKVKSGKRVLTILWGKDTLQWRAKLEGSNYTTPLCQWAISEQFELIETEND